VTVCGGGSVSVSVCVWARGTVFVVVRMMVCAVAGLTVFVLARGTGCTQAEVRCGFAKVCGCGCGCGQRNVLLCRLQLQHICIVQRVCVGGAWRSVCAGPVVCTPRCTVCADSAHTCACTSEVLYVHQCVLMCFSVNTL
jgi:hypothetical protein